MKEYEYLEDEATADLAIKASAKTLKKAFENTAKGLINAIVNTDTVKEQEIKYVAKKSENLKALLYDFLEEIIFFHDAQGLVFKTVIIKELDTKTNTIKAVLKGEVFDSKKHEAKNNIKAITYFGMQIFKQKNKHTIKVTVDL